MLRVIEDRKSAFDAGKASGERLKRGYRALKKALGAARAR